MDSATGKKAIGEMLDGQIAGLKKGFTVKEKGQSTKKEKTEEEKLNQTLQKDIKACLVSISYDFPLGVLS